MLGIFSWLRNQVRLAVLGGFADAVSELHDGTEDPSGAITKLQDRLRPALPAPKPQEPEETTPVQTNGRGRKKVEA